MQRLLVMTVIGHDRPGLVESVAAVVAEHGGNWLESRMSRLGGQFAGILRVEVPLEKEGPLVAGLKALDSRGLTVVVHADQSKPIPKNARLSMVEIVGQDRPGIVRQISHAPALDWARWTALQAMAKAFLNETESPTLTDLPPLEYHQTKRVDHRLILRQH